MEEITVILTIWKRDHLEEQIESLLSQTYPPSQIWVYHCCNFVKSRASKFKKYANIKYFRLNQDLGYFGRFMIGLQVKTTYLYILDDDVIPSRNWIENSLALSKKYNAIISSSGRRLGKDFRPEDTFRKENVKDLFVGDASSSSYNFCTEDTFVTFGCNSWFVRSEWLHYFWSLRPFSLETGEDIHLSATCAIKASIRTLIPKQDGIITCGNVRKFYGFDDVASWKHKDFITKREKIISYFVITHGWGAKYVGW